MARCRTCGREVRRLTVRGGRLVFLCECADRTPVRCGRCRGPLEASSAEGERVYADCPRCWEHVLLDDRGTQLTRTPRAGAKPKPTKKRKRKTKGSRRPRGEASPRPHEGAPPSSSEEGGSSATEPSERSAHEEGVVRVRRVRSRMQQGYRSAAGAVEIEREARRLGLPSDALYVILGSSIFLAAVAAAAMLTAEVSDLARPVLIVGVAAVAIVAWVLAADRSRHGAHRKAIREERADRTVRLRIDEETLQTEPRADEAWDGTVELDRVARVRVVAGAGGMRRVRVALDDGSELTVLDGLETEGEIEAVVDQIDDALRVARAREGS